jgi:hypothetical protein
LQTQANASSWVDFFPDTITSRLGRLCQVLARDRAPRRPLNGIVLIVPFAAAQADDEARALIRETQNDLRVIRQATGLEAPLYVAVTGAGLPRGIALRFPPLPDLDAAEVRAMFQGGADWLCGQRMAGDLLGQFRLASGAAETAKPLRENLALLHRLTSLQACRRHLGRLLIEGTQNDCFEPGMVAGCYVLSADEGQDTAAALWHDLRAHHQTTTWTTEVVATAAARRRRAWTGYGLGLLGSCAGLAWMGWFLVLR